jgi:hypothetical protein
MLFVCQAPAVELGGINALADAARTIQLPPPANLKVMDRPGDDGTALLVLFDIAVPQGQMVYIMPQLQDGNGPWLNAADAPIAVDTIGTVGSMPDVFGQWAKNPETKVIVIDKYLAVAAPPAAATSAPGEESDTGAEAAAADAAEGDATAAGDAEAGAESSELEPGKTYNVQLVVSGGADSTLTAAAGSGTVKENLYTPVKTNTMLVSIIFTLILLGATALARANPGKLFIRRIAGLEAVEEAIGRATEMGKPVMQINGLDPLTTPSTIAAVNILGQIARKVAHYDSRLMVPSFDPVVMTVAQETVKQAYMEEGRPDAYREEDIFFVTDQQFSYVASVCGIMLREKPAANFFLGYFYAESLLLAETGQSTGAIQIAGTDSTSQLPFFITTCDYTLIGEELYAASAYLSREPILLGGLKGMDLSKAIIMLLILLGSVLATFGIDYLSKVFTPLG